MGMCIFVTGAMSNYDVSVICAAQTLPSRGSVSYLINSLYTADIFDILDESSPYIVEVRRHIYYISSVPKPDLNRATPEAR